ncbi:MAG: hypothetical protein QM726_03140 [Chitinophagaceae bacterium]
MKTFFLTIIFFASMRSQSQGVFRNQTSSALEKVVQDYTNQFKNIKGELLSSREGVAEYKSTIVIPGATASTVTQTVVANKQSSDWQSVLFTGSNFEQAKTHFEEFFDQIKNTIIRPAGQKAVIVNGTYIAPIANHSFTTIQFDMLPPNAVLQNLHIDLSLKNTNGNWNILLNVYDKERPVQENMVVK